MSKTREPRISEGKQPSKLRSLLLVAPYHITRLSKFFSRRPSDKSSDGCKEATCTHVPAHTYIHPSIHACTHQHVKNTYRQKISVCVCVCECCGRAEHRVPSALCGVIGIRGPRQGDGRNTKRLESVRAARAFSAEVRRVCSCSAEGLPACLVPLMLRTRCCKECSRTSI